MPGFPHIPGPLTMQHPVKDREEFLEAEMYMEPWIAWRCWALDTRDNKLRLTSITYSTQVWEPQEEMKAQCLHKSITNEEHEYWERNPHKSPNIDCGCGIYSVTTKSLATTWLDQKWLAIYKEPTTHRVVGEAKLWGSVLRFTKGFLSEYAYPKTIYVPHNPPSKFPISDPREIVQELKKTYRGVKVQLL